MKTDNWSQLSILFKIGYHVIAPSLIIMHF